MYREEPGFPGDCGWRFFSGDEEEAYISDGENTGIYTVNTVANYDHDIVPYLTTAAPCAYDKKLEGSSGYKLVDDEEDSEEEEEEDDDGDAKLAAALALSLTDGGD